MRKTAIVGEFGEIFTMQTLFNEGFEVDRLDAEGIDIAAYFDEGKGYGISVKTRCIQNKKNDSINLKYNDLCYTYDQSKKRGIIPAYAFVIESNDRIDLLIATQEYICKNYLGIEDIREYKNMYSSSKDAGSTKSINTSEKYRNRWCELCEEGIIYTNTLIKRI